MVWRQRFRQNAGSRASGSSFVGLEVWTGEESASIERSCYSKGSCGRRGAINNKHNGAPGTQVKQHFDSLPTPSKRMKSTTFLVRPFQALEPDHGNASCPNSKNSKENSSRNPSHVYDCDRSPGPARTRDITRYDEEQNQTRHRALQPPKNHDYGFIEHMDQESIVQENDVAQQPAQDHQSAEEDAGKTFILSYIARLETACSVGVERHRNEAEQNVLLRQNNWDVAETFMDECSQFSKPQKLRLLTWELMTSSFVGGRPSGRMEDLKEATSKRLMEVLFIIEFGGLSESQARRRLRTSLIASKLGYDVICRYNRKRARVRRCFGAIFRHDRAPMFARPLHDAQCPRLNCDSRITVHRKYWYRLISDQLSALCRELNYFDCLMNGCVQAYNSIANNETDMLCANYYSGEYFRDKHGDQMLSWNRNEELYIFLSFSTDGVEVYRGRTMMRTLWPVMFTVLNYPPEYRFQASNALLSGFVPGCHDTKEL